MGNKLSYERFLWFDRQVKGRRFPNTTSLAREFEISVKTAQRDIEFMRDRLNAPLIYDQTKKGYYYENDTFSIPSTYLSSSELTSLLVARRLLQDMSGSGIEKEITSAVDKITSFIKKHTSGPDKMDECISFHLIEYAPAPEDTFKTVLEACMKKMSLTFKYSSPARKDKTERTIDPYHLFNYMGTWHLIGYCHMRSEIRNFRINRISDINITDRYFAVKNNFNFKDYFQSSFGLYKGGAAKQVILRFTPEKAKWIDDQIWHKDQKSKILEDGSLELSFHVSDFTEIVREMLKHGAGVEVMKPEALRELIKAEAENIAKIY